MLEDAEDSRMSVEGLPEMKARRSSADKQRRYAMKKYGQPLSPKAMECDILATTWSGWVNSRTHGYPDMGHDSCVRTSFEE